LFVELPSVNFSPKREVVPQLNAIYRGLGSPTIDAWTEFGGATFDQSLRKDGQHLNQAGAKMMAELVTHAVGQAPESASAVDTARSPGP
jgi:lysophospholipase L1-like esterase